jgi:hypothetical protein
MLNCLEQQSEFFNLNWRVGNAIQTIGYLANGEASDWFLGAKSKNIL